jgi:hypothetical protein
MEDFEKELKYIKTHGYRPLTVKQLY